MDDLISRISLKQSIAVSAILKDKKTLEQIIDEEPSIKICPCCMEEHEMQTVTVRERSVFRNIPVEYDAKYHYCPKADEYYADEQQMTANNIAMKAAYSFKKEKEKNEQVD